MKIIKVLFLFFIVTNAWGDGRYLWNRINVLNGLNNGTTILDNNLSHIQIVNLNRGDLRILRNAIFAKYGYIFNSHDLSNFFSRFSWYNAEYNNVNDKLTEIDRNNILLIQSIENNYPNENNEFIGLWWDPPYNRGFAVDAAGPNQLRIYPNGIYVIVWTRRLSPEGNYTYTFGLWNCDINGLRFGSEIINVSRRNNLQNELISIITFDNSLWWKNSNNPSDVM